MKRNSLKIWEKILLNSHYGLPKETVFPFYDVDISKKITQIGCNLVKELEKKSK